MEKKFELGSLFETVTGVPISDCETIGDIDKVIEKRNGRPLEIRTYPNNLVPERGNVFEYTNKFDNIDEQIEKSLTYKK